MLHNIQERFEILTTREKAIVIATVLVVLWSAWDSFFYQRIAAKQKSLKQQIITVNTELGNLRQTAALLTGSEIVDPNTENQHKLDELKTQYDRLQQQIMFGSKKFVPPQLMAKALSDILKQNQQMSLLKLESLPPTSLLDTKQQHQPIYKHGLVMTFAGNYRDTLNYLQTLEALPWAIAWEKLDYQVKSYPMAEITIRAVTLSFDKEWLGV